jgi:hypothetical protein
MLIYTSFALTITILCFICYCLIKYIYFIFQSLAYILYPVFKKIVSPLIITIIFVALFK